MKANWSFEEDVIDWADETSFIASGFYWVIQEDKHQLTVAQTITVDNGLEDPMYNTVWKIPKGWIRKRKTIKI